MGFKVFAVTVVMCVGMIGGGAGVFAMFVSSPSPGPLSSAHALFDGDSKCGECHRDDLTLTPEKCLTCHTTIKSQIDARSGLHAGYAQSCESCHPEHRGKDIRPVKIDPSKFDHAATGFPLTGQHAKVKECSSCHTTGSYSGIGRDCTQCHQDPHKGRMGTRCQYCHLTEEWRLPLNSQVSHAADFLLTGKHLSTPCEACHLKGDVKNTPRDCESCHWVRKQDDPYRTRLGLECGRCHTPQGWSPANWDHNAETGFGLSGSHKSIACDRCHPNLQFQGTVSECYACHSGDYSGARDPEHKQAGFPTDCSACHRSTSWSDASFTHEGYTLTGAHKTATCNQCHPNGRYQGTPTDCYACHKSDFESAKAPDHVASGFSTLCEQCHTTTNWTSGAFDHNTTGFPLTGAHRTTDCSACHPNGRYVGTPTDCYSCHKTDYDGAKTPDHIASGFPTDCSQCHTTTGWTGGTFDHNATGFPLTGAHRTTDCSACHPNGRYQGTPTACYACHQADYDGTKSPDHKAAGFSTVCTDCHSTSAWQNGGFDHNTTGFPLEGAHRNVDCNLCHSNGRYQGTPTDCYACHQSDYDGARNPDHKTAGFPTDCLVCHSRTDMSWSQANFEHPGFPIHSPPHSSFTCSDCHPNPGSFSQFVCTTCHYKSKMDSEHDDVPGYRFDDKFCYSCHPDGRK